MPKKYACIFSQLNSEWCAQALRSENQRPSDSRDLSAVRLRRAPKALSRSKVPKYMSIGEQAAVVSSYVTSLPFAGDIAKYYSQIVGTTSASEFCLELVPILYVTLLPLLCALCACIGLCGTPKRSTMGTRVMKRVNHAIRADLRLVNAISPKKGKGGITSLADVEAGRAGKNGSPIKNKAAVRSQKPSTRVHATATACPSRLTDGCIPLRVPLRTGCGRGECHQGQREPAQVLDARSTTCVPRFQRGLRIHSFTTHSACAVQLVHDHLSPLGFARACVSKASAPPQAAHLRALSSALSLAAVPHRTRGWRGLVCWLAGSNLRMRIQSLCVVSGQAFWWRVGAVPR